MRLLTLSPTIFFFSQKLPLTAQEQMVRMDYDYTHTSIICVPPKAHKVDNPYASEISLRDYSFRPVSTHH